ncbi:MAG TPA: hypothetical protein VKJ67_00140 [Methylomirabilota bacterium]|nr:hypothetical protein [Methylomirabilota bacterium]
MWLEPGLAPLSRWTDAILLATRLMMGTVVKATKWHKPFTDYSYDLVLLARCLLLLALGPGAYRV